MCVNSVLSFIGYSVFFFIMINSLHMAKEEGDMAKAERRGKVDGGRGKEKKRERLGGEDGRIRGEEG